MLLPDLVEQLLHLAYSVVCTVTSTMLTLCIVYGASSHYGDEMSLLSRAGQ